jgi:type III pantothenate kinase
VLLLLDVGNTQTDIAICDPNESDFQRILHVATDRDLSSSGWRMLLSTHDLDESMISNVAISSVVPSVTESLSLLFLDWLHIEPLIVSSDLNLGIKVAVEHPERVGTDRLCNATAAYHLTESAAVVVDVGTATKIEAISRDGTFLGGAIAPGVGVSLQGLVARAAKLDTVPLEIPADPIGTNTVAAMQSGLLVGHLAMIEGMIERFRTRVGFDAPSILTGGYGELLWNKSKLLDRYEPELTLRGLLSIWRLNK